METVTFHLVRERKWQEDFLFIFFPRTEPGSVVGYLREARAHRTHRASTWKVIKNHSAVFNVLLNVVSWRNLEMLARV